MVRLPTQLIWQWKDAMIKAIIATFAMTINLAAKSGVDGLVWLR
jgi:hypothetical protein